MMARSGISGFRRATARRLRQDMTEAEMRLWKGLRRLPMAGSHFRRQVPIGPYVADFACMAVRLIVEVDGSQHAEDINVRKDAQRTIWLEREGYRVIRVWNSDVMRDLDGVLEKIHSELYGASGEPRKLVHRRHRVPAADPTPALRADPPPAGEGEES